MIWELPHALLSAGQVDDSGRSRVGDFHRLNQVLAEAVEPLQQRIAARYGPWLGYFDTLGGDWDERRSRSGLTTARALAWYNAERLADPGNEAATRLALERAVAAWVDKFPRRPWRRRSWEQLWDRARSPLSAGSKRRTLAPEGEAAIHHFRTLVQGARAGLHTVAEPLRAAVAGSSALGWPPEVASLGRHQRDGRGPDFPRSPRHPRWHDLFSGKHTG